MYVVVSAGGRGCSSAGTSSNALGVIQVPVFAFLHGPEGAFVAGTAGLVFTVLLRLGLFASLTAHVAFNALAAME